jgi:hypothetical protein
MVLKTLRLAKYRILLAEQPYLANELDKDEREALAEYLGL